MHEDHLPTLVAIGVLVFAPAIFLHELGHALVASAVGGDPTLVSSTDMKANLDGVDRYGFLAIGIAGSAVNWVLAILGLAALRVLGGDPGRARARYFAWLTAAVNGFVPALYMVASPLMGFGDWMTVLRRFEPVVGLRVATVVVGAAVSWAWWRLATRSLVPLALSGRATLGPSGLISRIDVSWLTGGGLALAAALWSPLGWAWALPIAAGSTLGTTWPLRPAARVAGRWARQRDADAAPQPIEPSRTWMALGAATALLFVVVVGRGIRL